ncbi:MAG: hypothetical protein M9949_14420 [Candidatus Kapabacteria bacterium]|nr:hypothetical protein [Candidatus Kapabacteria bacterium]
MKTVYTLVALVAVSILFVSCSKSTKDEIYDLAVKEVKKNLLSPSSAKFEKLEEGDFELLDSAGTEYGFSFLGLKAKDENGDELVLSEEAKQNPTYSLAVVNLRYESKNALGVMIANRRQMAFMKYHFSDGQKSNWHYVEIPK